MVIELVKRALWIFISAVVSFMIISTTAEIQAKVKQPEAQSIKSSEKINGNH